MINTPGPVVACRWRPTLTPAPPGEWVYDVTQHNGRVLDYVLNDGETWPVSTEFTVTLAAGDDVTSGVGTPLLESFEARISTETIGVISVDPLWQPAGDASRLCVASPILVRFTQAIDRAAVVPFLVIQESGWISNTETPLGPWEQNGVLHLGLMRLSESGSSYSYLCSYLHYQSPHARAQSHT